MKNILPLIAALSLVACSPDEQAQQHKQAHQQFQQAQQHLANATKGYLNDRSFPKAGEIGALTLYQQQQLDQAEKQLAGLTDTGSPGQRLASTVQLAAVKAYRARLLANQAASAWAHLNATANRLLDTVSGIGNAATLAKALESGKAQQAMDALRQRTVELQQQLSVAQAQVETLRRQLQELEGKKKQAMDQRGEKLRKAAELTDLLTKATGEKRRDMGVQAAQLRFDAARLTGQIESLTAQIDLTNARLQDALAQQASLQKRHDGVKQTFDNITQRLNERQKFLANARSTTTDFGSDLAGALNDLATQYSQQVIQPLDQAVALLKQAIAHLESAGSLPNDHPALLHFNLACRQAQLAHILHQQANALADYKHLIEQITQQAGSAIDPAKTKTSQDTLALVTTHLQDTAKLRTEQLNKALEAFDQTASQASDKPIQIACFKQLLGVADLLMETTGNQNLKPKRDEYQQKLQALQAGEPSA